jgi:hypothetical protein
MRVSEEQTLIQSITKDSTHKALTNKNQDESKKNINNGCCWIFRIALS